MSDTQAKATPSKAARELVRDLMVEGLLVQDERHGATSHDSMERAANEIQAALSDLLEKADIILCEVRDRNPNKIALMKALEPWKPGE